MALCLGTEALSRPTRASAEPGGDYLVDLPRSTATSVAPSAPFQCEWPPRFSLAISGEVPAVDVANEELT